MKFTLAIGMFCLLMLTQCAPTESASTYAAWDQVSYVNPAVKPHWGAMKSLEQPGIY
jgi:hypothetical protein